MTDIVNLSPGHIGEPLANARTVKNAGTARVDGWIVPNDETLLADVYTDLAAGPYNAFDATWSGTSLTVTIDTGEAVVGGAPLARDVTTDVTLPTNATTTVYVGWEELSTDVVRIGPAGDFNATNPRVAIWTFETDGSGVTAATDEREQDRVEDVRNKRYETSDGSGTKVDAAETADAIGGIDISNLLRGDVDDRTTGVLGFEANASAAGTLGGSDGEAFRVPGGTSDLVWNEQGGHGRVLFAWNAYYDSGTGEWRSIVGGEPHAAIGLQNANPGEGASTPNVALATASANANADEAVTWDWVSVSGGNLDLRGGEAVGTRIENRSSRPSNPQTGRIIYRTDKD